MIRTLKDMIKLRNNIIHKGKVVIDDSIWKFIILCRELITRILLKELDFSRAL